MTQIALKIRKKFLEKKIECSVLHLGTIKPLDIKSLKKNISDSRIVFTLEEHVLNGGFGSSILEFCSDNMKNNLPKINRFGLNNNFVEKYGWHGRTRAIHCISLACHPIEYQIEIAKRLASLNIGVICCPSAAIGMTQHSEYNAPIHNSIAPVRILKENGVRVSLGVDNVEDVFVPFCDADLLFEIRLLAESTRIYDIDMLTESNNDDKWWRPTAVKTVHRKTGTRVVMVIIEIPTPQTF